jgi:hypothetical protein
VLSRAEISGVFLEFSGIFWIIPGIIPGVLMNFSRILKYGNMGFFIYFHSFS